MQTVEVSHFNVTLVMKEVLHDENCCPCAALRSAQNNKTSKAK